MLKTRIIVNVSDAKVSNSPDHLILTHSLGSCVAVSLYDPQTLAGAMLHYQLPDSKIDIERANQMPFMFADTGMTLVLNKLISMGVNKKRLKVKIAGGAAMDTGPKGFDIGKRNHIAIRKFMWQNGLIIDAEDVGGNSPRNMYLDIASGVVTVKYEGQEKIL